MQSNRSVTEVLKFGDAAELLRVASVVCRQWSRAANSDEVWWTLCDTLSCDSDSSLDPKAIYYSSQIGPQLLLFILYDKIKIIDTREVAAGRFESAVTTIALETRVDNSNAYCFLTANRVVCLGVGESAETIEINLKTLAIKQLPNMCDRRWYPGLLRFKHYLYVFGGRVTSCEKLNLLSCKWESISGHLKDPLEALMPAEHKDIVYLAGSATVETFHLKTEAFSSLPFRLPDCWWYTICLVHENDLIVIQASKIERWGLGSSEREFRISYNDWCSTAYYSNCLPVWFDGKFYTLHNEIPAVCGVFEFDPQVNKLREVMHWTSVNDDHRSRRS